MYNLISSSMTHKYQVKSTTTTLEDMTILKPVLRSLQTESAVVQ